jgi:hypothetical protein
MFADGMNPISNTEDVIDSREVIARIEYLQSVQEDESDGLGEDEAEELANLISLQNEAEGYSPDWQYGSTLIHADYFEIYARELAEDIGAIDPKASWPLSFIDWEAAADALQEDYTEVDFGGESYWIR